MRLQDEFMKLEFSAYGTVASYKNALWVISCDRAMIDDPVSSKTILLRVLGGAAKDPHYQFTTQSMLIEMSKTTGGLTEDQIYGILYALDKTNTNSKPSGTYLANAAANTRGGGGSSDRKPNVKCYGCGNLGHYHRECKKFPFPAKDPKLTYGNVGTAKGVKAEDMASMIAKAVGEAMERINKGVQNYSSPLLIDSGCSHSMTPDKSMFLELRVLQECNVKLADGVTRLNATHVGTIRIPLEGGKFLEIPNVLLVPSLEEALISVKHLTSLNYKIEFSQEFGSLSKDGVLIAKFKERDNLYLLPSIVKTVSYANAANLGESKSQKLW